MKIVGKILLIIGSVLFLVSGIGIGVTLIQSAIAGNIPTSWDAWLTLITTSLTCVVLVFGGLGGIFYAIGVGPFRKWVAPIAIVLLVLWIINLVTSIIALIGGGSFWDCFKNIFYVGVPEALYVLGYIFSKKR